MPVSIRKIERQRLKDDRGKERDEKKGVSGRAREKKRCFNLVIVSAFLNPFKKKGSLPAISL